MNNITFGNSFAVDQVQLDLHAENVSLAWFPKGKFEQEMEFYATHVAMRYANSRADIFLMGLLQNFVKMLLLSLPHKKVLLKFDLYPKKSSQIRLYKGLFYQSKSLKLRQKFEKEYFISGKNSVIVSAVELTNPEDISEAEQSLSGLTGGIILLKDNESLECIVEKSEKVLDVSDNSIKLNKVRFVYEFCNKNRSIFIYSPQERRFFDLISDVTQKDLINDIVKSQWSKYCKSLEVDAQTN